MYDCELCKNVFSLKPWSINHKSRLLMCLLMNISEVNIYVVYDMVFIQNISRFNKSIAYIGAEHTNILNCYRKYVFE